MNKPIVWTIAGSDSGGGAGIQADLKTINQLGAYGASVITAVTAQNTRAVSLVEPVSGKMIAAQIKALAEDLPPDAIKLGMLYGQEAVEQIVLNIEHIRAFIVCDPVLVATSGDALSSTNLISSLKEKLIPRCDLFTPNLEEAHALVGKDFSVFLTMPEGNAKDAYVEELADMLLQLGCRAVLVKGGSGKSSHCQDFWTDGKQKVWLTSLRSETRNTHGTGCTLSSAIASAIALGYDQLDAIVIAKAYVNQGLRTAPELGSMQGPMAHLGWPECEQDLPWLTARADQGRNRPHFADCGQDRLGFYPIIDSYDWLKKLLPLGVKTAQLRIKNLQPDKLEEEISASIALAQKHGCRLFINDYWELAIKHAAYGVHLGQDDLAEADIDKIEAAGLRLGVSTHCYREVARALALRPSYLAIGPIHATTTKVMSFAPQGIEALKRWRRSLSGYPLVAIGGIFLDGAGEVIEAGADAVAVVRDVSQSKTLEQRVAQWLAILPYSSDRTKLEPAVAVCP